MDIQLIAYDNEIEIATNLIIQFWQEHNHFIPSYEDACENLREWTKAGHFLYFISTIAAQRQNNEIHSLNIFHRQRNSFTIKINRFYKHLDLLIKRDHL